MNVNNINLFSDRAVERYRLFLTGLNDLYNQGIQTNTPGSDYTRNLISSNSYIMANTFINQENENIANDVSFLINEACLQTTIDLNATLNNPSNYVIENGNSIAESLELNVRVQLERDIASLLQELRLVAFRGALNGKLRGISERASLSQLQHKNQLEFSSPDRAGRRWSSLRLIRTMYRSSMIYVWNESALITLADYGQDKAIVNHPDGRHKYNGEIISLTESSDEDLLNWNQIRETVFHPNTNAWIGALIED